MAFSIDIIVGTEDKPIITANKDKLPPDSYIYRRFVRHENHGWRAWPGGDAFTYAQFRVNDAAGKFGEIYTATFDDKEKVINYISDVVKFLQVPILIKDSTDPRFVKEVVDKFRDTGLVKVSEKYFKKALSE